MQTPVLAAISSRYRERENHIATDTFPVFISLCKNNTLLKMRCTEEFTDREAAARAFTVTANWPDMHASPLSAGRSGR